MQQMQMKSIKNVLLWLTLATIALTNTGCSSFGFGTKVQPIETVKKSVDKTALNIPEPDPIDVSGKDIKWILITPENAEETFAKMENNKVLFGLDADGYQDLSILIAEIRTYIHSQRAVLLKYKEYYEPAKKEETK